jgi:hypothetical protein
MGRRVEGTSRVCCRIGCCKRVSLGRKVPVLRLPLRCRTRPSCRRSESRLLNCVGFTCIPELTAYLSASTARQRRKSCKRSRRCGFAEGLRSTACVAWANSPGSLDLGEIKYDKSEPRDIPFSGCGSAAWSSTSESHSYSSIRMSRAQRCGHRVSPADASLFCSCADFLPGVASAKPAWNTSHRSAGPVQLI